MSNLVNIYIYIFNLPMESWSRYETRKNIFFQFIYFIYNIKVSNFYYSL